MPIFRAGCLLFPAHGRGLSVASGHVAMELGPYGEPLEPQETLLLYQHYGGAGSKGFRNEYLESTVLDLLISRHVGFPGVGVDRHRGVAASAQSGQVVESYRPVTPRQVCAGGIGYQELQFVSRQDSVLMSSGYIQLNTTSMQTEGSEVPDGAER